MRHSIKNEIVAGFKTALLWIHQEDFEDIDTFSDSAELFIDNLVKDFIKETNLFDLMGAFTPLNDEYSIGELIGHDLFLSVGGFGAGFLSKPNIYNGFENNLDNFVEKKVTWINDIFINDESHVIEIE